MYATLGAGKEKWSTIDTNSRLYNPIFVQGTNSPTGMVTVRIDQMLHSLGQAGKKCREGMCRYLMKQAVFMRF